MQREEAEYAARRDAKEVLMPWRDHKSTLETVSDPYRAIYKFRDRHQRDLEAKTKLVRQWMAVFSRVLTMLERATRWS